MEHTMDASARSLPGLAKESLREISPAHSSFAVSHSSVNVSPSHRPRPVPLDANDTGPDVQNSGKTALSRCCAAAAMRSPNAIGTGSANSVDVMNRACKPVRRLVAAMGTVIHGPRPVRSRNAASRASRSPDAIIRTPAGFQAVVRRWWEMMRLEHAQLAPDIAAGSAAAIGTAVPRYIIVDDEHIGRLFGRECSAEAI
jgi:hypothetical protein